MIRSCRKQRERGFGIVENLVAISLLGIAIVGTTSLVVNTFHMNAASRSHTAVMSDVEAIIDSYRSSGFASLLDEYGIGYSAIVNGQTVTRTVTSAESKASYQVTLMAIKTSSAGLPEAIRLTISSSHRRGKLGTAAYQFETLIAQVNNG